MARKPKPVTWYIATPADGIIERSRKTGTPVNLADNVGQVIDHPSPCANLWFDESEFSYFRMDKRVGEVLEDTGIWPAVWPIRLWTVQPLGETGNWSHHHYPYRLLSHQIRVLEETDPLPALGANGREVLDVIRRQIPDRAARWAADWDTDPQGMEERRRNWRLCGTRDIGRGEWAQAVADLTSYSHRESAAQRWAEHLATNTVDRLLAAGGFSQDAVDYARSRAADLIVATQHQARLDTYVLDALRGVRLDSAPSTVAA
ncbi:hypothetical protein ABZ154_33370 [Streptomyces sp. NPDC006261]|uniref:hypothetical protein n=1 Tax=Streptomyces sp. NPDC006261 TaxID=3156739 RepID=UPI0033B1E601